MDNKFKIGYVIDCLKTMRKSIQENQEVPFEQFCQVLDEFCFVFKELNSFLGIAFSDVKDKTAIIKANNQRFSGYPGFFSFIKMEMQKKIHLYNGKGNKKAPEEYKTYSSTARNLLRMMWLLTFIKVTFTECSKQPYQKLSDIFSRAYDEAFGDNHGWLVRKSAKVAIMTSSDRKRLLQVVIGVYDEKAFSQYNAKFLQVLVPVHDALWNFYKENDLTKLQ